MALYRQKRHARSALLLNAPVLPRAEEEFVGVTGQKSKLAVTKDVTTMFRVGASALAIGQSAKSKLALTKDAPIVPSEEESALDMAQKPKKNAVTKDVPTMSSKEEFVGGTGQNS